MTNTNRRRELENQEASPVTAWLHRFSAFAFIFLSAAFTIWVRLDDQFMTRARVIVSDVFQPITLAIYLPVAGVIQGLERIGDHFDTVEKLNNAQAQTQRIAALEEEIERLMARILEAEALAKIPPLVSGP